MIGCEALFAYTAQLLPYGARSTLQCHVPHLGSVEDSSYPAFKDCSPHCSMRLAQNLIDSLAAF